MRVVAVLFSLLGLCCAFDSIEHAVERFNDESHLLFTDPGAVVEPCSRLRVFTRDNIVVPELGLGDEVVIRSLEDALEDFKTNYSIKKDREWERVIAAKRLVENGWWWYNLKGNQKVFLDSVVGLVFQHYERRALDIGSEELKLKFKEVKRKRYPDNIPKSLEQVVFEGNGGTWEEYRQFLSQGGNVPPWMSTLSQRMFRKHVVSRVPNIALEKRGNDVVRISISSLENEQLGMVARNLWWLPYLETVEIRKSGFDLSTTKELAKNLECLKHLTTLDLFDNKIRSEAVEEIAEKLAGMPSLKVLDLGWNRIGMEGATAIASKLASMRELTNLNLGWNDIGNLGAIAIAENLANAPKLVFLNLSANGIYDSGANAIVDRLSGAPNLRTLGLVSNLIRYTEMDEIADRLAKFPNLTFRL